MTDNFDKEEVDAILVPRRFKAIYTATLILEDMVSIELPDAITALQEENLLSSTWEPLQRGVMEYPVNVDAEFTFEFFQFFRAPSEAKAITLADKYGDLLEEGVNSLTQWTLTIEGMDLFEEENAHEEG